LVLETETGYPRVTALTGRAWARKDLKQYNAALADIDEAIKAYPNSDRYELRAKIFLEQKNYDRAIEDLTASIKLERNEMRFAERAEVYSARGEIDLAISDLTTAIEMNKDADFLAARGAEYLRKKNYDRAIADFNEALNLRPNWTTALFGRGLAKNFKGDRSGKADIAKSSRKTVELYFGARGLWLDKLADVEGAAFCRQIKRIASQAPDGFRKLRAASYDIHLKEGGLPALIVETLKVRGHMKLWYAREMLSGADDCTTLISDDPILMIRNYPLFSCSWSFYDHNTLLAQRVRLARALTACYGMTELKPDAKGVVAFSSGRAEFSVILREEDIDLQIQKVPTHQQQESCDIAYTEEPDSKSRDMKICLGSFLPN
jgi:Flp pilus assembly protein TadD